MSPYRLRRLPTLADVPKYVVPLSVSGPVDFTVLAVWSKGGQTYNYIEAVVKAVAMYGDLIASLATVLIGDLNSNVIWDARHPADLNHSALVAKLAKLGLVSAYHTFHQETEGSETQPTYYFHWKQERPFHIDYCFIPSRG